MKQQLSRVLTVLLALSLIIISVNCGKSGGSSIDKYVPADATMVMTLDFQELLKLKQVKELEAKMEKMFGDSPEIKKAEATTKALGMDLKKDLKRITVAFWIKGMKIQDSEKAIIIELNYNKEKLLGMIKSAGIPLKDETYNNVSILNIGNETIAFINNNTIASGNSNRVKQVIDASQGKIDGLGTNDRMKKFSSAAGSRHILVMGFVIPEQLKNLELPIPAMVKLKTLESLVIAIDPSDSEITIVNNDPDANQNLIKLVNGIKLMASNMPAKNAEDKIKKEMLEKASFSASGDKINITVPSDIFFSALSEMVTSNLGVALQKGKQKATMGDMKSVGVAIESFMTDTYKAPEGASLEAVKDKLMPFYIRTLPLKDGWGNNLLYKHGTTEKDKDLYWIASPGKDGKFNGWDQTGSYIITTMDGFNNDIIFANGQFVYHPKVR